jgi:hypothetical protein
LARAAIARGWRAINRAFLGRNDSDERGIDSVHRGSRCRYRAKRV